MKMLTTKHVAAILGVTTRTVERYRVAGVLKPTLTTLGGHARYKEEDVGKMVHKEFGPAKEIGEMTKEERLVFGAALVKSKDQLFEMRMALSKEPVFDPENTYDVVLSLSHENEFSGIFNIVLCAADSSEYDIKMRDAGIGRCERLREFALQIIEDRLAELECKIRRI